MFSKEKRSLAGAFFAYWNAFQFMFNIPYEVNKKAIIKSIFINLHDL